MVAGSLVNEEERLWCSMVYEQTYSVSHGVIMHM